MVKSSDFKFQCPSVQFCCLLSPTSSLEPLGCSRYQWHCCDGNWMAQTFSWLGFSLEWSVTVGRVILFKNSRIRAQYVTQKLSVVDYLCRNKIRYMKWCSKSFQNILNTILDIRYIYGTAIVIIVSCQWSFLEYKLHNNFCQRLSDLSSLTKNVI